jgi:hypothetical protein
MVTLGEVTGPEYELSLTVVDLRPFLVLESHPRIGGDPTSSGRRRGIPSRVPGFLRPILEVRPELQEALGVYRQSSCLHPVHYSAHGFPTPKVNLQNNRTKYIIFFFFNNKLRSLLSLPQWALNYIFFFLNLFSKLFLYTHTIKCAECNNNKKNKNIMKHESCSVTVLQ